LPPPANHKILFILHFPPPIHGAAIIGKYIKGSSIINTNFDCTYINLSTSKNLNEKGKGAFKKLWSFFRLYSKIFLTLIKNKYEVCYVTINSKGAAFFKEMIVVLLLKSFRSKIVYHYHNKGVSENQNSYLFNWLYQFQFKNAKAILLSPLLNFDVSKYLSGKQLYYCANGIPFGNTEIDSIKSKIKKKSGPEILFLSHMMKEKGIYILLQALNILKSKGIKFKATLIGEWADLNQKDFNDFLRTNNLEVNVFYLGQKYGEEKRLAFESADIFVLPTLNDCFPLVILESMKYGLPVISTDEGAIPEIVKNGINGFIIPKNDAFTLAEKIEYLINNKSESVEMGKRGFEIFKEKYTLPIFEKNFVQTLNQIITDYQLT
jgi:glycosyltransferase involved in cell wall biosynthesis